MEKFRISIASLPDRENLVAEIFYEGVQWVEISQENDQLTIQFYAHPRQKYWEFSLEDSLKALQLAKDKLLNFNKKK